MEGRVSLSQLCNVPRRLSELYNSFHMMIRARYMQNSLMVGVAATTTVSVGVGSGGSGGGGGVDSSACIRRAAERATGPELLAACQCTVLSSCFLRVHAT